MESWWRRGLVSALVVVLAVVVGASQQVVPNPDTYIWASIGDVETLDPAWHYDTTSATAIFNIYETLIFYDGEKVTEFIPVLATDWEISEDGLTYTFTIREGVKFHEGGDLTPEDVVYSLQRALLQDRSGGPIHMMIEPILDVASIAELAEKVGDLAACEKVKEAIKVVDGKVVIRLSYPFLPFLQILAGSWASILDKEWMIEQGDWDCTCENWRKWHDPAAEESVLFNKANGTGPFKFERWVPEEEISLVRNENYWRATPAAKEEERWGLAKLARVVMKVVPEWGTRLAMFEAGDADMISVPRAYVAAMDPLVAAGKARMYKDLPGAVAQSGFFNFLVAEGSPFMPLLGGVPKPDLLSDIHLRRALNYAFDVETYIREAWLGEAWPLHGPIIKGRLGFNPEQPIYEFDMEKAEEELRLAWGGKVWKEGMRLVLTYNVGNVMRKFAAEMVERHIEGFNEKRFKEKIHPHKPFALEVLALPWPAYLKAMDADQLSVFWVGWLEDYAHPHNWVHPYMYRTGAFAIGQNFHATKNVEFTPVHATFLMDEWTAEEKAAGKKIYPTLQDLFDELVDIAKKLIDLEKAELVYFELNRLAIEYAINLQSIQLLVRHYEQPWLLGWFYNPAYPGDYYYWLWKSQPIPFELAANETKKFALDGSVALTLTAGPAGAKGVISYTHSPWRVNVIDETGGLAGQPVVLTYLTGPRDSFYLICSNVPANKWAFGFAWLNPADKVPITGP